MQKIDSHKSVVVNKTNGSHKCSIFYYWNYLEINFGFQLKACDGCHDLLQNVLSFKDVVIVTDKGNVYRIYFGVSVKIY